MKMKSIVAALALAFASAWSAQAAEIRVFSSNALKTVLEELGPRFEKASEHKIAFTFGTAVGLKGEIEKGATFDVAILTAGAVDDLIKQGKMAGAR
ncbi:MAG TPA: substrate-binding domain-containing protein, partial [Xanthobacteraceae bacterium]|nr:substrate-binding domain-containing protein [Xanthobacteraceae bacterium]